MLTPEGELVNLDEQDASCGDSEDSNAEDYYKHEYPDQDDASDSSSASGGSCTSNSGESCESF